MVSELEVLDLTYREIFTQLLSNKDFVYLLLTITGIFYIVAGIQYWTANYMITILKINAQVATSFVAIACITGPLSGVLVGGLVTSYYGGYNTK